MANLETNPSSPQPKIAQRLILRTLILLVMVALLLFAYQWYREAGKDPGALAKSDTAGMIAAVEYKDDGGQEVVLFKPDGSVLRAEGWKADNVDRDLAWSPDGNFLYFVTNRKDDTYHVFRWSPGTGRLDQRTSGARGRSNPSFPAQPVEGQSDSMLLSAGGFVYEFTPREAKMQQVIPPTSNEIVQSAEEGGAAGQMTGVYGKWGDTFGAAKWFKGKRFVAAIIKRDEGEVLIVQPLVAGTDGKFPRPFALAAGERVDFDVSPTTGALVYAVVNFQYPDMTSIPPEMVKGNVAQKPYQHILGIFDPGDDKDKTPSTTDLQKLATQGGENLSGPILIVPKGASCVTSPKYSPDGQTILFVGGEYSGNGTVKPQALVVVPAKLGAAGEAKPILPGEIFEASWHPNGQTILFARRTEAGKRTIFAVNKDGTSPRNVSGDSGNYGFPFYSPQSK